jgi:hypothetical protein
MYDFPLYTHTGSGGLSVVTPGWGVGVTPELDIQSIWIHNIVCVYVYFPI